MDKDEDLIRKAKELISACYKERKHHIACALKTKSGKTYIAVYLEATVGRIAVCAEAIALGMAAADGDTSIDTIVAVNKEGMVVSPCGMCRELISDYSADAFIIMPDGEKLGVLKLLPHKYKRN